MLSQPCRGALLVPFARRGGQIELGGVQQRLEIDASYSCGDGEIGGQVRVFDAHLARRSSSSRSSLMIFARRALNLGLSCRRSTPSINDACR